MAYFEQHPDAAIITSLPGLGSLTGARVLAEIGDDRSRFAAAKSLKAYAGSAPVTRASGKSLIVTHRRIKNQRLAAAGYVWAFCALTASPGARVHYDRRRAAGDRHAAAQRNLFNRLLGCLHHCLGQRQPYRETVAFPPPESAEPSHAKPGRHRRACPLVDRSPVQSSVVGGDSRGIPVVVAAGSDGSTRQDVADRSHYGVGTRPDEA